MCQFLHRYIKYFLYLCTKITNKTQSYAHQNTYYFINNNAYNAEL